MMKCIICHEGHTVVGETTVTVERNQTTRIFRKVPAETCGNCGEVYIRSETQRVLQQQVEKAFQRETDFKILDYSAPSL